ncbi:MAG: hypothetical protein IAB19_03090, partial [Proteobacteria bacterium]|nr:hypothetical protein [Candidatus Avisuccinivibrio stercorigallinarum]
APVIDQNELTGEAPRSIARSQAIAFAKEREEQAAREAALNAPKPFVPLEIQYTEEGSGEGPEVQLDFSAATKARDPEAGAPFEHSSKAGGFAAAEVKDGVDEISEPGVYQVSFGGVHHARPFDEGDDFERSTFGSGFAAARTVYSSGMVNTAVAPGAEAQAAEADELEDEVETSAAEAETLISEAVEVAEDAASAELPDEADAADEADDFAADAEAEAEIEAEEEAEADAEEEAESAAAEESAEDEDDTEAAVEVVEIEAEKPAHRAPHKPLQF